MPHPLPPTHPPRSPCSLTPTHRARLSTGHSARSSAPYPAFPTDHLFSLLTFSLPILSSFLPHYSPPSLCAILAASLPCQDVCGEPPSPWHRLWLRGGGVERRGDQHGHGRDGAVFAGGGWAFSGFRCGGRRRGVRAGGWRCSPRGGCVGVGGGQDLVRDGRLVDGRCRYRGHRRGRVAVRWTGRGATQAAAVAAPVAAPAVGACAARRPRGRRRPPPPQWLFMAARRRMGGRRSPLGARRRCRGGAHFRRPQRYGRTDVHVTVAAAATLAAADAAATAATFATVATAATAATAAAFAAAAALRQQQPLRRGGGDYRRCLGGGPWRRTVRMRVRKARRRRHP